MKFLAILIVEYEEEVKSKRSLTVLNEHYDKVQGEKGLFVKTFWDTKKAYFVTKGIRFPHIIEHLIIGYYNWKP